jgi:hypothetical protein
MEVTQWPVSETKILALFQYTCSFPNLILQYNKNSENITVRSHLPVSVSSSHILVNPFTASKLIMPTKLFSFACDSDNCLKDGTVQNI